MMSRFNKWWQNSLVLPLLVVFAMTNYKLVIAQEPELPKKDNLEHVLFTNQTFSAATQVDTLVIPEILSNSYTLDVKAKVSFSEGRGLDIEARNSIAKGFRLSIDEHTLSKTVPLSKPVELSATNAEEYSVVRVAVENEDAHIYQNGVYLQTIQLSTIYDIVGGLENNELPGEILGTNYISEWAGTNSDNSGKPSDYGWGLENSTANIFNTANAGSGVRYIDVNENSSIKITNNGVLYTGRIMFIRWDSDALSEAIYTFPVTLEANTVYNFSMLHGYWANAKGSKSVTVSIGQTSEPENAFAAHEFNPLGARDLTKDGFSFTSNEAGTYYLTFKGTWALYTIGELSLNQISIKSGFIFGKNYPDGQVDIDIASASFQEGAYAPSTVITGTQRNIIVTDQVASYPTAFNTNFIVPGKTDLHLTGEHIPMVNSSVSLNSNQSWLFFDNISPSQVIEHWLEKVTVKGANAVNNPDLRIAIYKNGTVIIPNGTQTSQHALEVFTNRELTGNSATYEIDSFHTELGEFDNNIRSLKLHRGYMATLASNSDGSGFSRVYIANDKDLEVNELPAGLDSAVSFIRVFKWDWISKKGKAGWSPAKLNCTWYYDWNIGGSSTSDYQYTAIRQHDDWPDWEKINHKKGVNHLLGFNEPDRPDQADMTVEQAIEIWPEMMKSGMRLGSPSPANPFNSWLPQFLDKCEELNYRVDFAAIHCYWGGLTPEQWYSQLKKVYDYVKRPLWITEWNNGANWTSEYWPDDQDAQFQKQLNDMKEILYVLDTTSFVERYAIYDWVENKRAMILADTLTPAGKYYAANKSNFAFSPAREYIHTWSMVAPVLTSKINEDDYFKMTINWKDLNGEMGSKYILERLIDGRDSDFLIIQEFSDYVPGSEITYEDSVYAKASYRVQAFGLQGNALYSNTIEVIRDPDPVPPLLQVEVLSSSIIRLSWDEMDYARSYNLKRSLDRNGPFETVSSREPELIYMDENLISDTTYFYTISALNSAGESKNSDTISGKTKKLIAPDGVSNPMIASADSRITLSWSFMYDAMYKILKSDTKDGTYDTLVTALDTIQYVDSAVVNGKTYFYKLLAYNEAGVSPVGQILEGKPVEGLHLYVSFDETQGTFAEDSWGGYHAALKGDASHVGGYIYSGALSLSGENDAHALLPGGIVSTLDDFTIATWVKLSKLSKWMRIFDFGSGSSSYMFLTPSAGSKDGMNTIRYGIKNGDIAFSMNYTDTIPLDEWIHFAVTQCLDTVRLYLNGEMVSMSTEITLYPSDLGITSQNYIGKSQWADPLLNGAVDEFKIFNYALSKDEIIEAAYPSELSVPVVVKGFSAYSADSKVTLTWDLAYDVVYDIYRTESLGTEFEKIASYINALKFVDSNVSNSSTYFYKIVAFNETGRSPFSEVLQAMPVEGRHVYYDFEEDEGIQVRDKWSGYRGSLSNNAQWKTGRMNLTNAVALDKSKKSYIELDEGLVSTMHDFTISSWVMFPEDIDNNARFFDFGSDIYTFMILAPKSGSKVRYKIKCEAGTYDKYISYDLPLGEWVHIAITQQNDVFNFYVNAELVFSDSSATVYPEDMGFTTKNYLGRSQWSSDPYTDNLYDDFKIYNYALSKEELLGELRSPQEISFENIPVKYIGDPDFTLNAVASSGLEVVYSSADPGVAVVDSEGIAHITGVGTAVITAQQIGNEEYLPAIAMKSLTVHSLDLQIAFKDGNEDVDDNIIMPHFQVINNADVDVDLEEITVRYWLTMENYSGAIASIYYATLGDVVFAKYTELEEPRRNALGFVEYGFDSGSGLLESKHSSGAIQTIIANKNWGILNERDDYSFVEAIASYQPNEKMTLYRNGHLVWGKEPQPDELFQLVEAKSLSNNNNASMISFYLELDNLGNIPLQYSDLTLKYWFTSDGDAQLNYSVDYAFLGMENIYGQFKKMSYELPNTDTYFELSLDSELGKFYPLSSSGNIQIRINKSDWSAFSETNDYSYNPSQSFVTNEQIAVYYQGELIFGEEPVGVTEYSYNVGLKKDDNETFSVYPNPVRNNLTVKLNPGSLLTITSVSGETVWKKRVSQSTIAIDLSGFQTGLYIMKMQHENIQIVKKIIKE